jgi:NAD(P)H-dependent FMN reductase
MLQLKVIVGSTRTGRAADLVIPWITQRVRDDARFDVDVLDLRDWPLPMFSESYATVGDPHDPTYSNPIVKRWNKTIAAVVAYSGGAVGGARAVEHLAQISIETELVPLRNNVLIPFVHNAFDETGRPRDPHVDTVVGIVLDDLAWWARALHDARGAGVLPPAQLRLMAASTDTSK